SENYSLSTPTLPPLTGTPPYPSRPPTSSLSRPSPSTVTPTTEIYTLSLHDALPIWSAMNGWNNPMALLPPPTQATTTSGSHAIRSEEHTSELQSRVDLVCRLLLEKKKERAAAEGSHARTYR